MQSGAGHAFAEAIFFEEILFEAADLSVEEVVGLMNQADRDVGNNVRRPRLDERPIGLIGLRGLTAEASNVEGFAGIFDQIGKLPVRR